MERGADPHARDDGGHGRTPADWASHKKHDEVAAFLVEASSRAVDEGHEEEGHEEDVLGGAIDDPMESKRFEQGTSEKAPRRRSRRGRKDATKKDAKEEAGVKKLKRSREKMDEIEGGIRKMGLEQPTKSLDSQDTAVEGIEETLKQDIRLAKHLAPMTLHKPKRKHDREDSFSLDNPTSANDKKQEGSRRDDGQVEQQQQGSWNEWNFWKLPPVYSADVLEEV
jgi:hypothetical protein